MYHMTDYRWDPHGELLYRRLSSILFDMNIIDRGTESLIDNAADDLKERDY